MRPQPKKARTCAVGILGLMFQAALAQHGRLLVSQAAGNGHAAQRAVARHVPEVQKARHRKQRHKPFAPGQACSCM